MAHTMLLTAIYPGTFDPITNGHINIIERAAKIFDQLVVGVAADTVKKTLFTFNEREQLVKQALQHISNVKVCAFQGLLIEFVKQQQAKVIVRGIRAIADFEYERQMASMNQALMPEIETVFLTPAEKYTHISSSFVREIALLGGNVSGFVAAGVVTALQSKKK
jgi:pantetheine-phosphate adenylyltransferase